MLEHALVVILGFFQIIFTGAASPDLVIGGSPLLIIVLIIWGAVGLSLRWPKLTALVAAAIMTYLVYVTIKAVRGDHMSHFEGVMVMFDIFLGALWALVKIGLDTFD